MRATFFTLTLLAFVAAPAAAQGTQKPTPPTQKPAPTQATKPKPKPVPKQPIGFRGFAAFDYATMSATSTFTGMTGSSSITGFGAGAEILNVWRKAFLRFGFSTSSVDGTRGFATEGSGFVSTGIPITIGVRYVEIAGGWRMYPPKKRPARLPPSAPAPTQPIALYAAGGLLIGTISQESPFAMGNENSSATGNGFVFLGGLEYAFTKKRNLIAGVEAEYRSVGGGVLGTTGSVSGAFNENNAGGAAVRVLFGYKYKK